MATLTNGGVYPTGNTTGRPADTSLHTQRLTHHAARYTTTYDSGVTDPGQRKVTAGKGTAPVRRLDRDAEPTWTEGLSTRLSRILALVSSGSCLVGMAVGESPALDSVALSDSSNNNISFSCSFKASCRRIISFLRLAAHLPLPLAEPPRLFGPLRRLAEWGAEVESRSGRERV